MGKKLCGSAPSRTELRKYMFYVFKTQKSRFFVSKIENLFLARKKAPAGAHPGAPNLESQFYVFHIKKIVFAIYNRDLWTMFMYLQYILFSSQYIQSPQIKILGV